MGHNVEIAINGAGSFVDTFPVSDGAQTVERQGVVLVDDSTYAARAKVQNAEPASADYGLSVRRVCAGASIYQAVAAASTNTANIKASAGRVTGWCIYNNSASYPVFVKFHNTASAPTAGSGVVYTIGIPPGAQVTFDDDDGLNFATGIGISIVQGIALADTTALAASDCVVCIHFK